MIIGHDSVALLFYIFVELYEFVFCLQDQAKVLEDLENELHERQQADAVASSNYDESVKEIKSQNKKLKEINKHMNDASIVIISPSSTRLVKAG